MATMNALTALSLLCCVVYVSAAGASIGRFTSKSGVKYGYAPSSRNMILEDANRKSQILDALSADLEAMDEGNCYGKRCSANDQCCRGSVCVDLDGLGGSCFPVYGVRQGEPCQKDHDCSAGLLCMESEGMFRTCQARASFVSGSKGYNDECVTSNECDVSRGLCCQTQRRHRGVKSRRCLYFKDTGACLGAVDLLAAP